MIIAQSTRFLSYVSAVALMSGAAYAQTASPAEVVPSQQPSPSDTPPPTNPAAAAAPAAASSGGLQEIVVTANRRQENLQKVPIAVTAITAANAKALGITDPQSLVHSVPGLQFDRQAGASTPYIRGIGSSVGQAGDEPSVAFYVDDVYYPAGAASVSNFASVDSIEVEKGPQGTLFGRNATGGVLQVFTKNPSHTEHLDLTGGFANYKTPSGSIYFTAPVSDTLAFNVAAYASKQYDGWGRDQCQAMYGATTGCTTHSKTFTGYDYGGRAKIEWTPTDRTTFLLTGDYDKTRTEEGLGFHPFDGTLIAPFTPAAGVPGIPGPPGKYDDVQDEPSFIKIYQGGLSLKATQEFDFAKLVSISAYRRTDTYEQLDNDASPFAVFDTRLRTHENTFTQELQLLSKNPGWFSWIVGAFYMHDMASSPYEFYGAGLASTGGVLDTYGRQRTDSYSAFAQSTIKPWDSTRLTLGIRYTIDRRQFDGYIEAFGVKQSAEAPDGGPLPTHKTFSDPSARVSLDHNFAPNILGYVAYNRGFKSGLYNTTVEAAGPIAPPVKPETVDAYTAGFKTEFFDHKLRVNVEGFYYNYSNIQIDNVMGAATILTNAAKARIKGVDVDITARPISNFTVNLSVEYLHARYVDYQGGVEEVYQPITGGNIVPTPGPDLSGNNLPQSPPFTLTLSGNYKIPTSFGHFDLGANYFHGGNYYFSADNGQAQISPAVDRQPILNLLGGSLTYTTSDEKYSIGVWVKNATNKLYYSFAIQTAFASYYSPAPPRTFGVTAQAHF
jgi:iron complex outermembrane receptor protein